MPYIELSDTTKLNSKTKIMIFAEGTIFKPRYFFTWYFLRSYVPIGNAEAIIASWAKQGAEIVYCTSLKGKSTKIMVNLLRKFHFGGTRLYYRNEGESYKDIAEEIKPDILIEDDCKSIGGENQMCITFVEPKIKQNIKSIVIKEFQGIDKVTL